MDENCLCRKSERYIQIWWKFGRDSRIIGREICVMRKTPWLVDTSASLVSNSKGIEFWSVWKIFFYDRLINNIVIDNFYGQIKSKCLSEKKISRIRFGNLLLVQCKTHIPFIFDWFQYEQQWKSPANTMVGKAKPSDEGKEITESHRPFNATWIKRKLIA